MKLFEKKKLEDLLLSNWTKFVDYKSVSELVIKTIPLYANDWSIIQSKRSIQTKKIYISKIESIPSGELKVWISFEMPYTNKTAVGTLEVFATTQGDFKVIQMSGNFYFN